MAGLDKYVVLNNYEKKFLHRMNEMRKQNILCDVRFIIKDKEFPCHKIMLMNATLESDYFKTLFTSKFSECDSDTIPLKDIEPEAIEQILTAIYTTQFHLHRSNAYYILRASHMFMLTEIFNDVVSCIMENPEIDFLIETCLFAQITEREDLHYKCIAAMAADLNNLSMTDSFNEKITFDLFKMILKHENLIKDKEALFQIIMRWSIGNKSDQEEVLLLLNTANLRSGCLNEQTMAKLIVNSYNANDEIPTSPSPTSQNENMEQIFLLGDDESPDEQISKAAVCYNVYLNTIDVKSGAKGWVTLQSKPESNEHEIINYQQSNSSYRKVKKVGTKLYCFEYDEKSKKNSFSCFENGVKTCLASPWPPNNAGTEYYDIEAVGNFIYLITGAGKFWTYDCGTNVWMNESIQYESSSCNTCIYYGRSTCSTHQPLAVPTIGSPKLLSCNGELYIVGVWQTEPFSVIPNQRLNAQYLNNCPHKFTNSAVCCYDKKLVICGSNHDDFLHKTVSVYDMTAKTWHNLPEMNIGRANHTLNHHNGYLYAIENKSMVSNEKYNIELNKWTCIPSLPQRLNFIRENITLATGSVFNCTIE